MEKSSQPKNYGTRSPYKAKKKSKPIYTTNNQLIVPKSVLAYKARKLQTLIRLLDQAAAQDPTQVDPVKYIKILDEFGSLSEQIKKEKERHGMDKKLVDTQVSSKSKTRNGKDSPFSMDTGIPAGDPSTE